MIDSIFKDTNNPYFLVNEEKGLAMWIGDEKRDFYLYDAEKATPRQALENIIMNVPHYRDTPMRIINYKKEPYLLITDKRVSDYKVKYGFGVKLNDDNYDIYKILEDNTFFGGNAVFYAFRETAEDMDIIPIGHDCKGLLVDINDNYVMDIRDYQSAFHASYSFVEMLNGKISNFNINLFLLEAYIRLGVNSQKAGRFFSELYYEGFKKFKSLFDNPEKSSKRISSYEMDIPLNIPTKGMSEKVIFIMQWAHELLSEEDKEFLRKNKIISKEDVELYLVFLNNHPVKSKEGRRLLLEVCDFELMYNTYEDFFEEFGDLFEDYPHLTGIHFNSLIEITEYLDDIYVMVEEFSEKYPSWFLEKMIENRSSMYSLEWWELFVNLGDMDVEKLVMYMKENEGFAARVLNFLVQEGREYEGVPELLAKMGEKDLSLLRPYFEKLVEGDNEDIIKLFIENDFDTVKESVESLAHYLTDDILLKVIEKDADVFDGVVDTLCRGNHPKVLEKMVDYGKEPLLEKHIKELIIYSDIDGRALNDDLLLKISKINLNLVKKYLKELEENYFIKTLNYLKNI